MVSAILEEFGSGEFLGDNNSGTFVYHHANPSDASVRMVKGESDVVDVVFRNFERARHAVHHEVKPGGQMRENQIFNFYQ